MPDFLLDTQTIRYWFDMASSFHGLVRSTADALPPESHKYVSAISLGEVQYGIAVNSAGMGGRLPEYAQFVRSLGLVLDISRHTAEPYGLLRAKLFNKYAPRSKRTKARRTEELVDPATGRELGIDENDVWLTAQAIERNLVLVTNDKVVLGKITDAAREVQPGFSAVNWAATS